MDIPQKALKGLVKETGKLFTGSNKPTWNPEDSIAEKREWSSRNSAFHSSFTSFPRIRVTSSPRKYDPANYTILWSGLSARFT